MNKLPYYTDVNLNEVYKIPNLEHGGVLKQENASLANVAASKIIGTRTIKKEEFGGIFWTSEEDQQNPVMGLISFLQSHSVKQEKNYMRCPSHHDYLEYIQKKVHFTSYYWNALYQFYSRNEAYLSHWDSFCYCPAVVISPEQAHFVLSGQVLYRINLSHETTFSNLSMQDPVRNLQVEYTVARDSLSAVEEKVIDRALTSIIDTLYQDGRFTDSEYKQIVSYKNKRVYDLNILFFMRDIGIHESSIYWAMNQWYNFTQIAYMDENMISLIRNIVDILVTMEKKI